MKKKMLIGGKWTGGKDYFDLLSPYDGSVLATVPQGSDSDVAAAVKSALSGFKELSALPEHKRSDILLDSSFGIAERKEEIAGTITRESGKPIAYSLAEVDRSVLSCS